MKKLLLVGFLLTLFKTHSADNSTFIKILKKHVSRKELNKAAVKAVTSHDERSTTELLQAGANLPVFTAAKSGHRGIAKKIATKAHEQGLSIPSKKRMEILNRLILSGVKENFHIYFKNNLLKPSDVTEEKIAYAKKRAGISPSNKAILKYLKKRHKKRKQQEKLRKEIEFNQETCLICLKSFEEDEITVLPCKHVFHSDCCEPWFKSLKFKQCPTCKQPERPQSENVPQSWVQWVYGDQT